MPPTPKAMISKIKVYLGYYRFPTTPDRITVADASAILAYDVIARGPIQMPRGYQPTRCQLEGKFFGEQRRDLPGLADPWLDPYALCRDLAGWCKDADVQGARRLMITGMGLALDVFPESFQWSPVGGYGDVQYQLAVYEERPLAADGRSWSSRPGAASTTWRYTTVSGDTLATIAGQKLGDATRWPEIRNLNAGKPGIEQEELPPGMTLLMPPTGSPSAGGNI